MKFNFKKTMDHHMGDDYTPVIKDIKKKLEEDGFSNIFLSGHDILHEQLDTLKGNFDNKKGHYEITLSSFFNDLNLECDVKVSHPTEQVYILFDVLSQYNFKV